MNTLYHFVITIGAPRQRTSRRYRHMLASGPTRAKAEKLACASALRMYRETTGFHDRPLNAKVDPDCGVTPVCQTPDEVAVYGQVFYYGKET